MISRSSAQTASLRFFAALRATPIASGAASFRGTPGAPVLFPSWSFDELRSLPPGKGGGVVAKAHKERVRTIEVSSKWELFDVDTPDDLQTPSSASRKRAQIGAEQKEDASRNRRSTGRLLRLRFIC